MSKSIDGFFDGRSAEEIERIKNTLKTAFPPPDASPADRPIKQMRTIIEAEDILAEARNCVDCICLAAETLDPHQQKPIWCVANIASDKINEAIALLGECRQPAGADREAA